MSLQISILTPERPFWNGQAEEITLSTETGDMGVLTDHAAVITGLEVGALLMRTKDGWNSYAIMGGFALIQQNQVIILANEVQSASDIDPEEAKMTFDTAKANLEKAEGVNEKVAANFDFKRAKARFQAIRGISARKG